MRNSTVIIQEVDDFENLQNSEGQSEAGLNYEEILLDGSSVDIKKVLDSIDNPQTQLKVFEYFYDFSWPKNMEIIVDKISVSQRLVTFGYPEFAEPIIKYFEEEFCPGSGPFISDELLMELFKCESGKFNFYEFLIKRYQTDTLINEFGLSNVSIIKNFYQSNPFGNLELFSIANTANFLSPLMMTCSSPIDEFVKATKVMPIDNCFIYKASHFVGGVALSPFYTKSICLALSYSPDEPKYKYDKKDLSEFSQKILSKIFGKMNFLGKLSCNEKSK